LRRCSTQISSGLFTQIDLSQRAGEIERVRQILANPLSYAQYGKRQEGIYLTSVRRAGTVRLHIPDSRNGGMGISGGYQKLQSTARHSALRWDNRSRELTSRIPRPPALDEVRVRDSRSKSSDSSKPLCFELLSGRRRSSPGTPFRLAPAGSQWRPRGCCLVGDATAAGRSPQEVSEPWLGYEVDVCGSSTRRRFDVL